VNGQNQNCHILCNPVYTAYHTEIGFPVIQTLICDDAPQFNWLTCSMMLCWIHEGRHYKKLMPIVAHHQQLQKDFLKCFWEFYDQLLDYREQPEMPEPKDELTERGMSHFWYGARSYPKCGACHGNSR
jgi:hypothetical protein